MQDPYQWCGSCFLFYFCAGMGYNRGKWKKTLLVFFLLLAITTLVMSGLAIADAQEEQSEELRGVTGASFTVNANNGYTLQPVTDEMIEEIAAIDGVESYNTSHWTIVNLYHHITTKPYRRIRQKVPQKPHCRNYAFGHLSSLIGS